MLNYRFQWSPPGLRHSGAVCRLVWRRLRSVMAHQFNPLESKSNNMKLVHWPSMGGLLHLVQQGGDWVGPQPDKTSMSKSKSSKNGLKSALMVHRCLRDKAPQYLSNYCVPVSEVASRQQLRSVSRHQLLLIPRYRLRTFGHRAFAVAGPTSWNPLADKLRTYYSDTIRYDTIVGI